MQTRCLGCMKPYESTFGLCPYCGYMPGTPAEEAIHMAPGTLLQDRYVVGKVLGFGGFGVTYIAWDNKLEQRVAIKEYLPGEFSTRMPGHTQVSVFSGDKAEQFADGMHQFVEEARRLAQFQDEPGIVTVYDSFEENSTAYIVMEYLEGEPLTDRLKRDGKIQEDEAVAMLLPLMNSLQAIHEAGILHRDIAPDNIFLTADGQVKLIDFGAARYATTSHSRSLTVIIKPGYSPEEQYRSRGDQGPHTDVYALGATLYKMITGVTPPDAMERRTKYETQNKDILVPPQKYASGLSLARRNAILNAMNVRIEDRTPDVASLIKELNADPPAKRIYGKIKKIDVYAWPLWLKIVLPVIAAAVLTFGVLLLTGVIRFNSRYSEVIVLPDGTVQVPDVEGLTSADAIKLVKDHKLDVIAAGNIQSEYAPVGVIVLQDPAAGAYAPVNSPVRLTVSAGTGIIPPFNGVATVPYIIWDTLEDAKDKLSEAGLGEPEIEEVWDDNVQEGKVISSDQEAGTSLPENTVLKITISKGSEPFALQSVKGMEEEKAKEELEGKGLLVTKEYRYDNFVEKGKIIEQGTAEGTMVRKGDSVTIVVSKGKQYVEIPKVVGKEKEEAETLLEQYFVVKINEDWHTSVPAGQVISQEPAAGKKVVTGTQITINVSKGKHMIPLTFDPNGGSVKETNRQVEAGTEYGDLPTPGLNGYAFDGWFTALNGGSDISASTIMGTEPVTVYAHWTKLWVLTFNANGGSVAEESRSVREGSAYGDLPVPSRSGYSFDGWFTAVDGGSRIESSTRTENGNTTVYAHWTYVPPYFTLTFNANGGSVEESSRSVQEGAVYGTLPVPTRSGYTFGGWFTTADGGSQVDSATKMMSDNVTVYAHWTVIQTTGYHVGDIITFGNYGGRAIEWQVLAVEGSKVLVISKYGLDAQPYNTEYTDVTWETCTLRSWLNGNFYNSAFSVAEKSKIQMTNVKNDNNPDYGTPGGNATKDKIFLLSIQEAQNYFNSDSSRMCYPTQYAIEHGCLTDFNTHSGACRWWLRSPGLQRDSKAYINFEDGSIYMVGRDVDGDELAVRPALWYTP